MTPSEMQAFEEVYISIARMWGLQTFESDTKLFGYTNSFGKSCRGFMSVMFCAMDYVGELGLQTDMEAATLAAGVGSIQDYAEKHPRCLAILTYYCPRQSDAMAVLAELRRSNRQSPRT
jgi:hypothetical protein